MQVTFERTGGVSGARITLILPEDSLPSDEAEKLEALVDRSRFFDLPTAAAKGSAGADRFHYRVTIQQGSRQHTVEVDEPDIPTGLRPLLDTLSRLARARGRSLPAR
jgi:hypothetical protein